MDKRKRKQKEMTCSICGNAYLKDESEANRNIKQGRVSYCSRSCAGKASCSHLSKYRNSDQLIPDNRGDEYTPFRSHLRRVKRRQGETNLNLIYLKELWEKQKGVCIYSKVELTYPKYNSTNDPIFTASLDRIDSSKGYDKGNVQYVSIAMNHMKNSMTHEQTLKLIALIKDNAES